MVSRLQARAARHRASSGQGAGRSLIVQDMASYEIPEFEREWTEFLNAVRTALPGVQLLFGFLLAVPFTLAWSINRILRKSHEKRQRLEVTREASQP